MFGPSMPELGAELEVKIDLPEKPISRAGRLIASAEVVRLTQVHSGEFAVGIKFLDYKLVRR